MNRQGVDIAIKTITAIPPARIQSKSSMLLMMCIMIFNFESFPGNEIKARLWVAYLSSCFWQWQQQNHYADQSKYVNAN